MGARTWKMAPAATEPMDQPCPATLAPDSDSKPSSSLYTGDQLLQALPFKANIFFKNQPNLTLRVAIVLSATWAAENSKLDSSWDSKTRGALDLSPQRPTAVGDNTACVVPTVDVF